MTPPHRPIAFVLSATDHGTLIVNRFDYKLDGDGKAGIGLGFQLLTSSSYDRDDVAMVNQLLSIRRQHHGDGVVAVDCGANIGVHSIEWARHMTGWGGVLAIEAQERLYYALAGNIAINNCFNARAIHAAVGARDGTMRMPVPNYAAAGSFGSLELRPRANMEFIGQTIDYADAALVEVRAVTVDSLRLQRMDLLKIDVEGMELEVLDGARAAIARHRPIIMVEYIKVGLDLLSRALDSQGYRVGRRGINVVGVHKDDPSLGQVKMGL